MRPILHPSNSNSPAFHSSISLSRDGLLLLMSACSDDDENDGSDVDITVATNVLCWFWWWSWTNTRKVGVLFYQGVVLDESYSRRRGTNECSSNSSIGSRPRLKGFESADTERNERREINLAAPLLYITKFPSLSGNQSRRGFPESVLLSSFCRRRLREGPQLCQLNKTRILANYPKHFAKSIISRWWWGRRATWYG